MFFFRIELSSFDDEKRALFIVPDIQDADENGIPVFSEKALTTCADYKQFVKDTKTSIVDVKYTLYKTDAANDINDEIFSELLSANNLEILDSNEFPITSGKTKGKSGGKDNTKMYLIIGVAVLAVVVLLIVSAITKKSPGDGDMSTTDSRSEQDEISDSSGTSDVSDYSKISYNSDTSSVFDSSDSSSDYVDVPPDTSSNVTDEPPQDTNSSGYTDGGYASGGNYNNTGNTQSEYTISFHANGGDGELAEMKSKPGQYVVLPSAEEASKSLTRTGYKLIGFSDNVEINYPLYDYKMPASDIMLFAVWEADEFTVNYNSNGGTGQLSSTKVKFNDEIPLPTEIAVYRSGLNLLGWNTDKNAKSELKTLKMPAENITLYAIWSDKKPTAKVTFHYDDSVMVQEVEKGELNMRQNFGITKDGYTLSGWFLENSPQPLDYLEVTGDCDVYGKWDRATYITVSIDRGYLNKSPLTYKIPLDMDGNATLKLPKINDRSSAYDSVFGCTYGYSTKKPDGEFGTIEYYGETEYDFRKDTTLYRVLNRYGGGDGSEKNPYIIDYYDQLLYLAENGASGYFIQTADIQFPNNTDRKPINTVKVSRGYENKSYNLFVYDGQNNSIRNLCGDGGLFGTLAASTIKNVCIDGANISSDSDNSGILVDEITSYCFNSVSGSDTYSTGNSRIQNCRVVNSTIYTDGTVKNVGGICGYGGIIDNCISISNSIHGNATAVGGIVGNACTVNGSIAIANNAEGGIFVGGIAGTAYGAEIYESGNKARKYGGDIYGCGVRSFVGSGDACGGIVGATSSIANGYIRSCYAADMLLVGEQLGGISGGDSLDTNCTDPHIISYCVVDNTNGYPAIGGEYNISRAGRMVISVPQDGLKVDGVLAVLNAAGSGFSEWRRDKDINGGYPYPTEIIFD